MQKSVDFFVLKDEINVINCDSFQKTIQWVKALLNTTKNIYYLLLLFSFLSVEYSSMAYWSTTSEINYLEQVNACYISENIEFDQKETNFRKFTNLSISL